MKPKLQIFILVAIFLGSGRSFADMAADSPVTFPKQGALPAKHPPDRSSKTNEAPEKDYYLFKTPERSLEQIAMIQAEMPSGSFIAPPNDWTQLHRARRILTEGGTLRLLALGDSIVNDTMRSGWVAKVSEAYPRANIQATVYVRGRGGCQHYKEEDRIRKNVLPRRPDLVFIGGISQRDIASIREVIHQLREGLPEVEILLGTGTFGSVDPRDADALAKAPHSGSGAYGEALRKLAAEERCAFIDMTTPWADNIKSSKLHPHLFYRDAVHANEHGEQILAKTLMAFFTVEGTSAAAPRQPYFEVSYPGSTTAGELTLGATYTLWLPPGGAKLRGVIVHQHGCGEGACRGGETAAFDLHWQALARKWDCALLGPSYHQKETDNCALWCDPRNGSDQRFQQALADLGASSGHPELATVPWCLWGHSGGANWAGTMLLLHPERTVAVWLRSGAPGLVSNDGKNPVLAIPDTAYGVPVMCNLGIKEKTDRFARVWTTAQPFFTDFRAKGGLIGFAPDPKTSHECGDSRYLAIPFFDACLFQRLPSKRNVAGKLKPMDGKAAWLAPLLGDTAQPAANFSGNKNEAVWLPNAEVARLWSEYVRTGTASDSTPPTAPFNVRVSADGGVTWDTHADFESGLARFVVERDGAVVARIPEKPAGPFGRALFQRMSYHDTPERPLPEMRWVDPSPASGRTPSYRVRAINSAGLESALSPTAVR